MALVLKPMATPTIDKPFSWDDLPTSPSDISSPASVANAPSPPMVSLPAKDMRMFGMSPLRAEYGTGIVRCNECKKPILRSALSEHLQNCEKILAMQTQPKKGTKPAELKKGTKRKAEDDPEGGAEGGGGALKKKKAAPKGRFRFTAGTGPIDLDKQCGVINDKGLPCSRSLTCKSHAMGAKRAVEGRSRKYDELLLDWQRLHNPNFVEPVKRETKKEKKEKKDKEKEEKKKALDMKKAQNPTKKSSGKKGASTSVSNAMQVDGADNDDEDVDSEVELDAMLNSLREARELGRVGLPMAVSEEVGISAWFVVRRERVRSCRGQLLGALMGNRGGVGGVQPLMRS